MGYAVEKGPERDHGGKAHILDANDGLEVGGERVDPAPLECVQELQQEGEASIEGGGGPERACTRS